MSRRYFDFFSYARNGDASQVVLTKSGSQPKWDGKELTSSTVKAALSYVEKLNRVEFSARAKRSLEDVRYERLRKLKFIQAYNNASSEDVCLHLGACECVKRYAAWQQKVAAKCEGEGRSLK